MNPNDLSEEEMETLRDAPKNQRWLSPREKSTVASFKDPVPQLWKAVTRGEDQAGRWDIHTFDQDSDRDRDTQFCNVIYLSECVAEEKCEETCRTRGAAKYRWFPNGCCECVDAACQGYGSDESRCHICHAGEDSG